MERRSVGEWAALIGMSILVAFPLGGAIHALVTGVIGGEFLNPLGLAVVMVMQGFLTLIGGGYMLTGETGYHRVNMYPWIIPTAFGMFIWLSGLWRTIRLK